MKKGLLLFSLALPVCGRGWVGVNLRPEVKNESMKGRPCGHERTGCNKNVEISMWICSHWSCRHGKWTGVEQIKRVCLAKHLSRVHP